MSRRIILLLSVSFLMLALCACDSGGSNGASLDGDVSVRIEGPSDLGLGYSQALFDDEGVDVDATNITIPSDGVWTKDLEDGHAGVRIDVTTASDESLTLQLRSDGNVLEEDTTPEDQGGSDLYTVEAGDIRDLGNLAGN